MMRDGKRKQRAFVFAGMVSCIAAHAASDARVERGEILYDSHCLACHTEQMHWRDQRLVTDLDSLARQVRRWQMVTRARWNDEDAEAVVRYLNNTFYHFPPARQEN